ncbi:MAG: serine protease [Hormoscilla sp.]
MKKKSLSLMLVGCVLAGLPLAIVTKQGVWSWQKPQKDLGLDVPGISETQPMERRSLPYEELYKRTREITVQVRSGDGREQLGSGIIIAFQDNRYTVLTNEHVVKNSQSYSIRTYAGEEYQARRTRNHNLFGRNDLAILEFNPRGRKKYLRASIGTLNEVAPEKDYVFAAGYPAIADPNDDGGFVFYRGRVLFRLPRPLKDGYQVGLSNDFEKGMSGGPLVNSKGEVVGINGKHRPLWGGLGRGCAPYEYEDGTPACDDMKVEPSSWTIPIETYTHLAGLPREGERTPRGPVTQDLVTQDLVTQDPVTQDLVTQDREVTGRTEQIQQDYFKLASDAEILATQKWKEANLLDDWREVEKSWQKVIDILNEVPRHHYRYEDAKTKIAEFSGILNHAKDMVSRSSYQPSQPQPDPYWAALREGGTASEMLHKKQREGTPLSLQDWEDIAVRWQNAIFFLRQVSDNHPRYEEVTYEKFPEYQRKLARVQSQVSKARENR